MLTSKEIEDSIDDALLTRKEAIRFSNSWAGQLRHFYMDELLEKENIKLKEEIKFLKERLYGKYFTKL